MPAPSVSPKFLNFELTTALIPRGMYKAWGGLMLFLFVVVVVVILDPDCHFEFDRSRSGRSSQQQKKKNPATAFVIFTSYPLLFIFDKFFFCQLFTIPGNGSSGIRPHRPTTKKKGIHILMRLESSSSPLNTVKLTRNTPHRPRTEIQSMVLTSQPRSSICAPGTIKIQGGC